jgi:hypothetical protein
LGVAVAADNRLITVILLGKPLKRNEVVRYVAFNDCAREQAKPLLWDKLCYFNSSVVFAGG